MTKSRKKKTNRKKRKNGDNRILIAVMAIIAAAAALLILVTVLKGQSAPKKTKLDNGLEVTEEFLTPNEYSRPEASLETVNGIVVHYTANPGSTAKQNRDYFEGLRHGADGTYASSHYIIGIDGEVIQCIPLTEIAYASNNRNSDTVSIECCHPDDSGKFTDETYDSLVMLVSWLCTQYNVSPDNIIRHYDVTGKECPKYFVDNEDAWLQFKEDVRSVLAQS